MSNTSLQNLKDLRSSYTKELVSALIGAGFSKNVDKSYPSWPQLLEDIVRELYPAEYNKAKRENSKLRGTDKESNPLGELVNRLGPLNIVSEYIRYRGVGHESIDVYVEKKIPYMYERDGAIYVKNAKIERETLSAHESLLYCDKFRNIYTTNYDNLLEKTGESLRIDCFNSVIRNSQDLSNSLTKHSIIKIHGSLRTCEEETLPYGFDGDKNLLYIVSKEDYETYQQRHEAFSFMMRMAMLQGKFCLVGFSGNDPNFQFWLQWMKDVLDKGDTGDIKVYLVDFYKEDLTDDVKLFYNNHRIGVINLLDAEIQSELFPEGGKELADSLSTTEIDLEYSRKELLTAFFQYLRGDVHNNPRREQGEYYSRWRDAEQLIHESKDVNPVLTKLIKVRKTLGPQKRAEYQQFIVNNLIRKKTWTKAETDLFAIAVSDMGLLPSAFNSALENVKCNLNGSSIWRGLQNREDTLLGEEALLAGDEDKTLYENALRLLFNLRFSELAELLLVWRPNGDYKYRVALLLGFFDKTKAKAKELIDEYVGKEDVFPMQKVMLAKQLANIIYNEFPGHYSLEFYYDQGLSSFNEIIITINELRKNEQNKILPYSVEDHSVCLNPSSRPFKESSRLLSYFINWGYTTYYNNITCVPKEIWMGTFCELFESYPFATLYYSSLYTDRNLLKRIGQEYAYSRYSYKNDKQKEVLKTILAGLGDSNLPWQNRTGLLIISSELYVAVKETEWYEPFKDSVLRPYLNSITENTDRSDATYLNVSNALESIYQREHVEECFLLLIAALSKNDSLVAGLINNNLNVRILKGGNCLKEVKSLIEKFKLSAIYPIVYTLNYFELLDAEVLDAVDAKVRKEGIGFAENNANALIQLSFILSSEDNIRYLKNLVLKRNVWDCGVREHGFTEPSPFKINRLSDRVIWTDEEIKVLASNLEKNLTLISERDSRSILEPLFFTKTADILISMNEFYAKYQAKINNIGLQDKLKEALNRECEMGRLVKSLASDDEGHVFVAIEFVNIILSNDCIERMNNELNVILNRALQKNKVGLALVLSEIRLLVEKYEQDMWEAFHDVLLQILNDYESVDYQRLNLNLSRAYQCLNAIANSAKNQNICDAIVDYWLTNEEVLRFSNVGRD